MFKIAMVLTTLVMLIVIYAFLAEHHGESRAREFCARFKAGDAIATAHAAAANEGEARLRTLKPDEVAVAYTGVLPLSRHFCVIEGDGGKVARTRYVYLD